MDGLMGDPTTGIIPETYTFLCAETMSHFLVAPLASAPVPALVCGLT